MIEINVNIDKLIELINKHSVDVNVFGHSPFTHKAIKAPALFEEIHTCSDVSKEEFVNYVNALSAKDHITQNKYKRIPEIDVLFQNVKFFGMFQEAGHENLQGVPHIFHRDIKKIIKLN